MDTRNNKQRGYLQRQVLGVSRPCLHRRGCSRKWRWRALTRPWQTGDTRRPRAPVTPFVHARKVNL